MKVRWIPGSLRLRITPGELEKLLRGQEVNESLAEDCEWCVKIKPGEKSSIEFNGPSVTLQLAAQDLEKLTDGSVEGVYFNRPGEPELSYYVEKDFPCAHPRPTETREPESETFPAPAGFKARHRTAED